MDSQFLYKAALWLRRFFMAVGAAMAVSLAVSLIAGLPGELVFLSVHGMILCGIGYLINDFALSRRVRDHSLRSRQEDENP